MIEDLQAPPDDVDVAVGSGVSVGIGVIVGVNVTVKVGLGVLVGISVFVGTRVALAGTHRICPVMIWLEVRQLPHADKNTARCKMGW